MSRAFVFRFLIIITTLISCAPCLYAQECTPPPITANSKIYNIFTPDQEMILGDLTYQKMSGDLRFLRDQEIKAYLNALDRRLVDSQTDSRCFVDLFHCSQT
jgi:predicted Zn-dependent protease